MLYLPKYLTCPSKIFIAKTLMLVIQQNNNTVCTPFQPHDIDLVNHTKLYHGSHPLTCVMFDQESKAQKSIDRCIGFRLYDMHCATSASLIFILWCEYFHMPIVVKFPNRFPTC